jgi:small subunit ribosomal protein S8
MNITDPIADMLTRIRNAMMVRHDLVLMPSSKTKVSIAKILKDEGFISDFETIAGKTRIDIKINLRYRDRKQSAISGLKRVSKPGLRIYVAKNDIPRIYGGMGITVISTSQGVMTGKDAWSRGIGGEYLCYVW